MMRAKVYKRGAVWWAIVHRPGSLFCVARDTWREAMDFALGVMLAAAVQSKVDQVLRDR